MLNPSSSLFALLALNASGLALAAPQPPSRIVIPDADEEVVVVTARRREEELQDVPIAVSAISGASLQATGSGNVGKLQQLLPSFQFYSTNPRNSAANIRGLGAPFGLTNDGIEQGVGVYVDEVYNSRVAATTFDFVDVERIEVLRGPQGTLYGKNTTAGAINITTRPPSFSPEARLDVSIGNLGYLQAKGSASGPLVEDRLAIRLGDAAARHHLQRRDRSPGQRAGQSRGARIAAVEGDRHARSHAYGRLQPPESRMLCPDLRARRRDAAAAQPPI
jgi:iron complex outermembrane receptor protein